MKKLILCAAIMVGSAGFAGAQTTGSQNTDSTSKISESNSEAKIKKDKPAPADKKIKRSNRVEFKSKRTKQVATPTGQQATGTNGTHANNPKNAGKSGE